MNIEEIRKNRIVGRVDTWVLKTRQIEKKTQQFENLSLTKMAFSSLSVQALPVPETKI